METEHTSCEKQMTSYAHTDLSPFAWIVPGQRLSSFHFLAFWFCRPVVWISQIPEVCANEPLEACPFLFYERNTTQTKILAWLIFVITQSDITQFWLYGSSKNLTLSLSYFYHVVLLRPEYSVTMFVFSWVPSTLRIFQSLHFHLGQWVSNGLLTR